MKARTFIKVGIGWLAVLMVGVVALSIAAGVSANQFLGLGIDLPFSMGTIPGRLGIVGFFFVGYLILLGWIPFLLIGGLRIMRERAAKPEIEAR